MPKVKLEADFEREQRKIKKIGYGFIKKKPRHKAKNLWKAGQQFLFLPPAVIHFDFVTGGKIDKTIRYPRNGELVIALSDWTDFSVGKEDTLFGPGRTFRLWPFFFGGQISWLKIEEKVMEEISFPHLSFYGFVSF